MPLPEYRYAALDRPNVAPFVGMTFPAYRSLLTHPDTPFVAVGAYRDDVPVGLALARPPEPDRSAEMVSLFVLESVRGQGVGTAMLARLEDVLVTRGAHVATATYVAGKATTPWLERLFANRGWLPPVPRMMVFKAEFSVLEGASWLAQGELDETFTVMPWLEVPQSLHQALRDEQEETGWIPADLEPWLHDQGCEPETSLALLRDGRIVGWVLNHRLDAQTLRFSAGWVRPELQRRGRLLHLYTVSGRRALALGYQRTTWTVPFHHEAKVAFARRWMVPFASKVEESRGTAKWLVPMEVPGDDDL